MTTLTENSHRTDAVGARVTYEEAIAGAGRVYANWLATRATQPTPEKEAA